jgi:hypothetical protein
MWPIYTRPTSASDFFLYKKCSNVKTSRKIATLSKKTQFFLEITENSKFLKLVFGKLKVKKSDALVGRVNTSIILHT